MESATRRKAREHHRLALIIAFAVNDPKSLDKVAPAPDGAPRGIGAGEASSTLATKERFEETPWW